MPLTLGAITADPASLKAALEQTVRYINQLEVQLVKLQAAQGTSPPLTLEQIRRGLSVTGSHPLNVSGLPGTLTQTQRTDAP